MSNEPNSHRTAVVLFAVAVIIAMSAALVTTVERIDTRTASNDSPPGTTGLAKPHPPLDRAPGQPVWATERHILTSRESAFCRGSGLACAGRRTGAAAIDQTPDLVIAGFFPSLPLFLHYLSSK